VLIFFSKHTEADGSAWMCLQRVNKIEPNMFRCSSLSGKIISSVASNKPVVLLVILWYCVRAYGGVWTHIVESCCHLAAAVGLSLHNLS